MNKKIYSSYTECVEDKRKYNNIELTIKRYLFDGRWILQVKGKNEWILENGTIGNGE